MAHSMLTGDAKERFQPWRGENGANSPSVLLPILAEPGAKAEKHRCLRR